jgi:UDP-glucose 4-epimerase
MKILVTGGAGFIGSHVVDAYIEAGHEVIVVDNLSTGVKDFIHPKARFYECDITSDELLEIFVSECPDIVNHHAAQMNVRISLEDPSHDARINILGLLNILQCSVASDVKKFIFSSSGGAVYGNASLIPTPENEVLQPVSPYGLAKSFGEKYVQMFHQLHGLEYTILRYANVYGPRQNPLGEAGVITIFITQMLEGKQPHIFGDGTQTRDYIYVADLVSANLLCLEKGSGMVFNLGTEKETSVMELFDALKQQLDFSHNPVHTDPLVGEVSRNALDCTHAKNMLGWEPIIDLQGGMQKTIEWFRTTQEGKK